jgi:hypothetical protein
MNSGDQSASIIQKLLISENWTRWFFLYPPNPRLNFSGTQSLSDNRRVDFRGGMFFFLSSPVEERTEVRSR